MKRICLLVVVILMSSMLFGCSDSPDTVVKTMYKDLDSGKIDEAYSFISKDSQAMMSIVGGKAFFVEKAKDIKKKKGIKDIQIVSKDVNGEIAEVSSVVVLNDGSKIEEKHSLVKDGGKWKIQIHK